MKKILIVDDSRVSRIIIKKCIGSSDEYEFCEAENGQVGLEEYRNFRPDVVFLDLTMPVMDGRGFLKEIKKVDGNARVIVCTADVQQKALDEVFSLGAISVVKKPPAKESIQEAFAKLNQINNLIN